MIIEELRSVTIYLLERGDLVKKYSCTICSHIYDPASGDADSGIQPGTQFEQLPDSWVCPECGAMKEDFEPMDA
ncbi:rubredoxin [Streptomyces ehimensis]|uniref:Rubredoxin n=1 Tax=Streptomyces ehimensis TaxID=68195 RepID=A0ABV9BVJ2_9ACTN